MILLDIDGVLNPLFSFTLQEDGFTTFSKGWATWSLNQSLHMPMMDRLDKLDKTLLVETNSATGLTALDYQQIVDFYTT